MIIIRCFLFSYLITNVCFIRKSRVLHCVLADEKYIHYLKTERISVILNEISRQPVRLCQEAKLRLLEVIRLWKRWPCSVVTTEFENQSLFYRPSRVKTFKFSIGFWVKSVTLLKSKYVLCTFHCKAQLVYSLPHFGRLFFCCQGVQNIQAKAYNRVRMIHSNNGPQSLLLSKKTNADTIDLHSFFTYLQQMTSNLVTSQGFLKWKRRTTKTHPQCCWQPGLQNHFHHSRSTLNILLLLLQQQSEQPAKFCWPELLTS